jgi:hypothetical protein
VDLRTWSPLRVEDGAWLRWWDSSGVRFDEPFYVDTVRRRMRHDAVAFLQPRTRLSALPELVARHRALPLAGLVLHWSRCGSTAVLRGAASDPTTLALSEPPQIDEVLRAGDPELLGAMVSALTQPRQQQHRCAVLKLDAWSTLQLPRLRAALPDVPWVFVWRAPEQVLLSHAQHGPGAHMVPQLMDPELFGLSRQEVADLSVEVYRARVLRALADAALSARDDRATFLAHHDLQEQLPALLGSWGLSTEGLASSLQADAKRPGQPYTPAPHPVPAAVSVACAEHLASTVEARRRA